MKKSFCFNSMLWGMALLAMLANIRVASGQTGKEQSPPIPENINKIFQTSCMPCHGSKGGMLPLAKIDFSKWAEYTAARKTEKASLICSTLGKGAMPPKSARRSHPELIPTKEQIDIICKWAESLKSKEVGK